MLATLFNVATHPIQTGLRSEVNYFAHYDRLREFEFL